MRFTLFSSLESRRERGTDSSELWQAELPHEEAFFLLQVLRAKRRRQLPTVRLFLRRQTQSASNRAKE